MAEVSRVQEPEPDEVKTLTVTWHPDAVTGAVERVGETVRTAIDPEATYDDGHGGRVSWNDLACLVDVAHAFMATPVIVLSDTLRRRLDHAYAAAHLGVSWEPGNPASTGGLSKDEALREASDFLVALYDAVTETESGEVSRG